MSTKMITTLGVAGVLLLTLFGLSSRVLETNNLGFYQIKQAAVTGELSVKNNEGTYLQLFGDIHTYKVSDTFFFDGTDSSVPITVRFQDGGTAQVHGSLKYRLSANVPDQLKLHKEFRGQDAVRLNLIAPIVKEALKQSAPHMTAEDSYSAKRSEFTSLVEDQITAGIFETVSEKLVKKDPNGNEFIESSLNIKQDKNGNPVVKKESTLNDYSITVIRFVITDIDYDETIDRLISMKKEAEQQKVVARANAEKAKQDAITAKEQGDADIAKAKAQKEVEKISAVTEARKEKEVAILSAEKEFETAKLDRQRAEEQAKAKEARGRADALVNKLKVQAGLTPQERAEWRYKTAVGVADKLSNVKFPGMMVIGGGQNGGKGALNPFDAVGLESFMRIQKKLNDNSKE